jgi:hypothetical protein
MKKMNQHHLQQKRGEPQTTRPQKTQRVRKHNQKQLK